MAKKIVDRKLKEHPNPEVGVIADDLNKYAAIDAVAISEGGEILIKGLMQDLVISVDILASKYKTLTIQEFVGHCSDIKSRFDLLRLLKRAKKNKELATEALNEALKEE